MFKRLRETMSYRSLLTIFAVLSLIALPLQDAAAKGKKGKQTPTEGGVVIESPYPGVSCFQGSDGSVKAGSESEDGENFNSLTSNKKKKARSKALKQKIKLASKQYRKSNKKNPDSKKTERLRSKLEKLRGKFAKVNPKFAAKACKEAFESFNTGNQGGTGNGGGAPTGNFTGDERLEQITRIPTVNDIHRLCRVGPGCKKALKDELLAIRTQGISAVLDRLFAIPSTEDDDKVECDRYLDGDYDTEDDQPDEYTSTGLHERAVCHALNGDSVALEALTKFMRGENYTVTHDPFDVSATAWHADSLETFTSDIREMVKDGILGRGGTIKNFLSWLWQHPAMLVFLDGNNNRKASADGKDGPNENWARELLELFGIGVVQFCTLDATKAGLPTYDGIDVAQLARAFTGWRSTALGNQAITVEVPANFDEGPKTVLRLLKPGGFTVETAEDVIDMMIDEEEVYSHVRKFYAKEFARYYVTATPDCAQVYAIANEINAQNGNLAATFRALLGSTLFLDASGDAIMQDTATFMIHAARATGISPSVDTMTDEILDVSRMWESSLDVFYFKPDEHYASADTVVARANVIQDRIVDTSECRDLIPDTATADEVLDIFQNIVGWNRNADQNLQLLNSLDQDKETEAIDFDASNNNHKRSACEETLAAMLLAAPSAMVNPIAAMSN